MISINEVEKYINNSYVILDLKSETKEEAISEMLIYSESNGLRINISKIIESIYKKEDIISSGLGYGVAFPHVRTSQVKDNDIIFAISKKGLNYSAIDKKPVHLLTMFLTNKNSNEKYLALLSLFTKISRMSMYPVILLESKTVEEFKSKFINISKEMLSVK
ncbi:PTS sugar transporter subunit IIA [uncultured Brachyspira sp.]|mgnify:FL=1|uniref:PTS sugar transporter subunit IIA n=1 Tax=uncultured Brachyspira sp. TaxID=221953 RepID=UPI00263A3479|nr:PTS sugar transporter subunit IIA [uncultured Brachyspira sp.]